MGSIKQIGAACMIAIMGIRNRLGMTVSNIVSIALVVLILVGFLAMAAGFRQAMVSGGSPNVAIILSDGARSELMSNISGDQLVKLDSAAGIARVNGKPLIATENQVIVNLDRLDTGDAANVTLRGVTANSFKVRPQLSLTEGRMPQPGTNEIIAGNAAAARFANLSLGSKIRLGSVDWQVVGLFEADGSVIESELWADGQLLASIFNPSSKVQSVRVSLDGAEGFEMLSAFVESDPTLKLRAEKETDYFLSQSGGTTKIINFFGWPLAVAMAIGAIAGALNTMYASVASRNSEIATLRILGFGAVPIFLSTIVEALFISLIGTAFGLLAAYMMFDGMVGSTMTTNFTQLTFRFALTWNMVLIAVIVCTLVSLFGSLAPAWRASRLPIVKALAGD